MKTKLLCGLEQLLKVYVRFLGQILYVHKAGISRCICSSRNRLGFYAEIQIIFGQCTYTEQKKKEAETQKMGRLVSKMFKNCSHFYL